MEALLVAGVAIAALAPILRGRLWGAAILVLAATALAATVHPRPSPDPLLNERPVAERGRGYVSSNTCQACHPGHYKSWHDSYHRTMTQVVTPETMLADWDGTTLTFRGHVYELYRDGDEFRIRGGGRDERAVISTGAHHQQIFWTTTGQGRTLRLFAGTWLVPEKRWAPFESTFLRPDLERQGANTWNAGCIKCHATAGRPGRRPGTWVFDSKVAEFGIACEACHGPGEEHARKNRNPRRRYRLHRSGETDDTIVNPRKLTARVSSQICGQCHSINGVKTHDPWWIEGSRYRPGRDLHKDITLLPRPKDPKDPMYGSPLFDRSYWGDGMVRVSGREYMGLIESPCFRGSEFSCLSCHSMHDSDPNDQLARDRDGDAACTQCHDGYGEEHTHHKTGSSGASCYNCHMPYTTYGLLKAIRSHTVSSPNVAESIDLRRPNACNLCHLDKTLAWTKKHLEEWYPTKQRAVPEGGRAAAPTWLLKGDAGQRALVAWSMGWEPAKRASGHSWLAPFLAQGLLDEYAAVRFIAERSLKRLEGFEDFPYDYVAPVRKRYEDWKRALAIWARQPHPRVGRELYIGENGKLDKAAMKRALQERDRREVYLDE